MSEQQEQYELTTDTEEAIRELKESVDRLTYAVAVMGIAISYYVRSNMSKPHTTITLELNKGIANLAVIQELIEEAFDDDTRQT